MSLLEEALRRQEEREASARKQPRRPRPPADIPADPVPAHIREGLKREPRTSLVPNLILPLFALLVFLALLYARRMVVAGADAQASAEDRRIPAPGTQDSPPSAAARGALDDVPQVRHPFDGGGEVLSDGGPDGTALPPSATPDPGRALSPRAPQGNAPAPVADAAKAAPAPPPGEGAAAGGAEVPPAGPPPAPSWPYFKVSAIANGKEKLVILNGSEMLAAGETSRAGVKVVSVSASSATFSWRGEERTLHRGDVSADPPAPPPPTTSTSTNSPAGDPGA